MDLFYQISIIVFFLFGGTYSLLIILFTIGWFRLNEIVTKDFKLKVSVIVPARNEAQNIEALLNDLKDQSFSKKDIEVLVIDDHSNDHTKNIILGFIEKNSELSIKLLESKNFGKKEALKYGIEKTSGDIILSIDADCRVGKHWVRNMQSPFAKSNIQMVSGPVVYFNEKSVFEKIQSLDFLSLVASAAGAIGVKLPFMCNGANLAFRKSAFIGVNGFEGNIRLASGDDVFLLHKIKKQFGSKAISFLKNENAIVETSASSEIKSFLQQRKRWASKSRAYRDFFTLFISISVAGFSLMLILFMLFSIYDIKKLPYFLGGMILKIVIDFTLLMAASRFFRKRYLLWYYLPVQIVYPLYTGLVSLLAFFMKNEWKGRKIN